MSDAPAMLVTGEESPVQVRGRAQRLDADCGPIQVVAETRRRYIAMYERFTGNTWSD
jgi:predicted ATP-dependent serine protease